MSLRRRKNRPTNDYRKLVRYRNALSSIYEEFTWERCDCGKEDCLDCFVIKTAEAALGIERKTNKPNDPVPITQYDFWGIAGKREDGVPKAVKLVGDLSNNPRVFESLDEAVREASLLNRHYHENVFEVYGLTIELHKVPDPARANTSGN